MGVVRRTASVVVGTTMLAVAALGITTAGARASTALELGTTAGTPNRAGLGIDGQPALQTQFESPRALATDADGDLYVADPGAHDVREITPDGIAHVVAGVPGAAGSDADGRTATAAHLQSPSGLLVTSDGLLIADPSAHRVVLLHGGVLTAFAGTGAVGSPVEGRAATASPLRAPTGLAGNGAGTIYVSDAADDTVWSISPQGVLHRIAGVSGQAGFNGSGGVATSALLDDPTGLAWASGHLVIADTGNHRVRSVSASGYLGELVGPAAVTTPTGLVPAAGGQVYVADAAGRVGVLAGGGVSWYAGDAATGYSPDGTPAGRAGLVDPTAVAISGDGRLLVAETGTSSVRDVRVAAGPPQQPAAPTAVAADRSITASWRPVDDGGSTITAWVVRAYAGGELVESVHTAGSVYKARLPGLTNGTAYVLTLTAVNAYGSSPTSAVSDPSVPYAQGGVTTVPGRSTGSTGGGVVLAFPSNDPSAPGVNRPGDPRGGAPAVTTYLHLSDPAAPVLPIPTATQGPQYGLGTSRGDTRPSVVLSVSPTAPAVGLPTAASTVQSVPLVPVRSFADAATDVATVGKKSVVPLGLVAVLGAFLVLQGVVDRRDPKLAAAPLHADRGLEFGPA